MNNYERNYQEFKALCEKLTKEELKIMGRYISCLIRTHEIVEENK